MNCQKGVIYKYHIVGMQIRYFKEVKITCFLEWNKHSLQDLVCLQINILRANNIKMNSSPYLGEMITKMYS